MSLRVEISSAAADDLRAGDGAHARIRRADLDAYTGIPAALGRELGRAPGVILVSGAATTKTAVSIGLATAFAARGGRAVLLECDLDAPAVARALGIAAAPGLHEYLRWEADARRIVRPVELAGPAVNGDGHGSAVRLAAVPAGRAAIGGDHLLEAAMFRHVLNKLRRAYELTVLCAPPLERGLQVLARIGANADAAVTCVDRERVSEEAAEDALVRLGVRAGGLVVGGRPDGSGQRS